MSHTAYPNFPLTHRRRNDIISRCTVVMVPLKSQDIVRLDDNGVQSLEVA